MIIDTEKILIEEVKMYICQCEICGEQYKTKWSSVRHCDKCWLPYRQKLQREASQRYIERRREKIKKETEARPDNVCEYCEKSFRAKRKDTKFCSPACRQAAYRVNKELKKESWWFIVKSELTANCRKCKMEYIWTEITIYQ